MPKTEPAAFDDIFREELEAIANRRTLRTDAGHPGILVRKDLMGVCLSGGGIRSATFNLGVLQGLAAKGLLRFTDYLSTVSGGGYIGSWFQGLCQRRGYEGAGPYADVEDYLKHEVAAPGSAPTDPITFLRKYSNYLAPQLGALSPDTWVIFTIWLRNTVLNQIIFALAVGGVFLWPVVLGNLASVLGQLGGGFAPWLVWTGIPIVCALGWAVKRISWNLGPVVERELGSSPVGPLVGDDDGALWAKIAAPVFAAAVVLSFLMSCERFRPTVHLSTGIAAGAGLLVLYSMSLISGGFRNCYDARHPEGGKWKRVALSVAIILCCSGVSFGLLTGVGYLLEHIGRLRTWQTIAWGPPLVILALASGLGLQVGLMGVDFPDSAREWYSRLAAKMTILSVGWAFLFAVTVFAPMLLITFFETWEKTGIAAGIAWILTTVAGFQAGKSPASSGTPPANTAAPRPTNSVIEMVAKVAPPLAVLGLLIAISTANFLAIEKVWRRHASVPISSIPPESSMSVSAHGTGNLKVNWNPGQNAGFFTVFAADPLDYSAVGLEAFNIWIVFLASWWLIDIAYLMSQRVNINEFSMNHFYKNRLVRCYLGASHGNGRRPNPFTGFDPKDDIPMGDLVPGKQYDAPYAIVNCALNLNHGTELAWQERKASSFVFTPLYCGYKPARAEQGYVSTEDFTGKGGPHLGLATAISGAAANPNWGYHTSPVTAFLMSIFNVRLGWWIGNTNNPTAAHTFGPPVALRYLFSELLGLTDEASSYLNLSDGGHFENLGLYELIRRRCKFIVVGDGEQDETYVFESLGGAIRKVRIDFGVEIKISPRRMFLKEALSEVHCAVGTIKYPGGATGTLLYIKSSLTGDESWDVGQYKKANDAFPQESTLNQFFTESQFESYRALGRHAVRSIFEKTTPVENRGGLATLFRELTDNWLPPTTAQPGVFSKHAEAYSALIQRLGEDKDLRFMDSELLPGFPRTTIPGKDSLDMRKAKLLIADFIQLMEDVYVDLNLEDSAQFEHPQNSGWIGIFKRWKAGTVFNSAWKDLKSTYGSAFGRFYEGL